MNGNLIFEKIWHDDSLIELEIKVNDCQNIFAIRVYAAEEEIIKIYEDLNLFKNEVYGGIYELNFGSFGSEYANGAFHAKFHFQKRGKIHISIEMQSSFFDFGSKEVAKEAKLFLITEPALLDNFILEFKSLKKEVVNSAILECVSN